MLGHILVRIPLGEVLGVLAAAFLDPFVVGGLGGSGVGEDEAVGVDIGLLEFGVCGEGFEAEPDLGGGCALVGPDQADGDFL